jgi:hypothetical protein
MIKEKLDIVGDGNCVSICLICPEIRGEMSREMKRAMPPLPKSDSSFKICADFKSSMTLSDVFS